MIRVRHLLLPIVAASVHFVVVGGAFALLSALLWMVLVVCGNVWCPNAHPSFFEAAGLVAFGYIVVQSSVFARRHLHRSGGTCGTSSLHSRSVNHPVKRTIFEKTSVPPTE